MTFQDAAAKQQNRQTYYTVWLVGPAGEREQIGQTQRKSGTGLMNVLRSPAVQARVAKFPDADSLRFKRTATALIFTNGWRIEFGGTIRAESRS